MKWNLVSTALAFVSVVDKIDRLERKAEAGRNAAPDAAP